MTEQAPSIPGARALRWRRYGKTRWEGRWCPRRDLVKRGLPMRTTPLWRGTAADLTPDVAEFIISRCQMLQDAMLLWGHGGLPTAGVYDGTVTALIACYQSDADSGYRKIRPETRQHYDGLLARIDREHGAELIADIKARTMKRWHEEWSKSGVAMAHVLVGMVRTMLTFGATLLECDDCRALKVTMHDMRFAMARPRTEILTADQASLIRAKAHERGWHSIALAQAFQFECMFRQKDVIGEWMSINEPLLSAYTYGQEKWARGIRWNEIDDNLILRHVTSKKGKEVEKDLKLMPMVMEELAFIGERPASGPVIICEVGGHPWSPSEFRRKWRIVADEVGVPKHVRNMDSRAGAITEATEAGAPLEHVKHAATHSDISMTQRYARNQRGKSDGVQVARIQHRNKSGTSAE